ncbi:MAG: DUF3857 and transglutaminase domain-containing protein [Acidobacteria bacterium]|nr:DUF3857 and transglutaminase domain-containing protein [Acidobacteriota bacterium]
MSAFSAALCAAMFYAVPGALAGAPDWLRAAAAMSLPAYPPETNAVMLLDEQVTTVRDDGEIRTSYRRAWKILRPEGRERAYVGVGYDGETRLTYLKAWAITPAGVEFEIKEKDFVETSYGSGSFYDDVRMKATKIDGADVGSVIGYEYEQRRRPFVFQDKWLFQDPLPVRKARFVLQLPSGWEYRAMWMNYADQKPQATGANGSVWEIENVAAIEWEPLMPPWKAVAGWLAITYVPNNAAQRAKSHASWSELGDWYAQLAAGRRDSSPEIKQKVAALTAGATSTLDKMRALAAFAQRDIRYVAIEIGIGGYQPHVARDIFSNRYGDCKDKATVLSTMLKEIGVESNYVLINAARGVTAPSFPSMLNFNHVILAIRVPPDVSATTLYATREHPVLGKLLFFDPTDESTPLGYLPTYLQKNQGLLVADPGGELIELPLLPPPTNRLLRVGKITLSPTGAISAAVKEIRWGDSATGRRSSLLRAQGVERQKLMESFLGQFLGGFRLRKAVAENLEKHDESLILNYEFDSENYAKVAGNLLLLRPRVLGAKGDDVMERKPRKLPVEFDSTTFQSDVYEFVLPPGFKADELPSPVEIDVGFAEYRSKVQVEGNILRYQREYIVKDVRVPTTRLEDLKKFNRVIAADERNAAVLARGTP